jgi:hypothetical protein
MGLRGIGLLSFLAIQVNRFYRCPLGEANILKSSLKPDAHVLCLD